MEDRESRKEIAKQLGVAIDSLVENLYSDIEDGVSISQEPEITSRICQRLEDKLDGVEAGKYTFGVTALSIPDRGPNSIEKCTGADIFLAISLEGPDGFDKGIFIQAKYDRNIKRSALEKDIAKMKSISSEKGCYVWVYTPKGAKVYSAHQVTKMKKSSFQGQSSRSITGFSARVLDCYAGDKTWGIPMSSNRRKIIGDRLREVKAKSFIDIQLKKSQ